MIRNLEGMTVKGLHIGETEVEGFVKQSVVKHGSGLQHLIELNKPMVIGGLDRQFLILDEEEITFIYTRPYQVIPWKTLKAVKGVK